MGQMLLAKTRIVLLAVLAAAVLLVASCDREQKKPEAPPAPPVTVASPITKTVTYYTVYTGNTKAQQAVEIQARVEGELRSVNFEVGARVDKDQLLFVIEPEPYKAKVDIALANLAVAKAQYQLAMATLVRKENAYKDRAVSEVDVIQAKAEAAEAAAKIEAAKAQVERAKIDYGYTHVLAPLAGRISRNLVDVGNLVGAGKATDLTSIVDDDPMYAYFTVSEHDLLEVMKNRRMQQIPLTKDGQPLARLAVGTDENFPHDGYLDWVDNKVDPSTGTIMVRGVFPNSKGVLIPGLFARVQVPMGLLKDALLVPDAALARDQRGYYLYTVDNKDTVQYLPVELGPLHNRTMRVITKGLKVGDRVVVNGLQRVRPGSKCTPLTEEQAKQMAAQQEAAMKAKAGGAEQGQAKEKPKEGAKDKGSQTTQGK